jgi:3-oxoacyl-[acyl-carrier protein] reductase
MTQHEARRAAAAGRVALVTGAARGLGLAIARRLAADGHPVALLDTDDRVRSAADALRDEGFAARSFKVDVSDEAAVAALPAALGDWWPRLAILVNNAGISPKHDGRKKPVAQMTTDEWQRVLGVNLTGAFFVTRACLPSLCSRGWGRIVMVTSQAARTRTVVPGAHYAATKAGLTGFARVLSAEVVAHGVTVNCVAPGRIETEMTGEVGAQVNASVAASIPIGRMGRADEVAGAVAFLVSDDASYLLGASIDVNGGAFMP